jgi:hypothetical protein
MTEFVEPHWIGIAFLIVPILLIGALILKRPVFWFLAVLLAVGVGYLHTTGAAREVGNAVLVEVEKVVPLGLGQSAEPAQ